MISKTISKQLRRIHRLKATGLCECCGRQPGSNSANCKKCRRYHGKHQQVDTTPTIPAPAADAPAAVEDLVSGLVRRPGASLYSAGRYDPNHEAIIGRCAGGAAWPNK